MSKVLIILEFVSICSGKISTSEDENDDDVYIHAHGHDDSDVGGENPADESNNVPIWSTNDIIAQGTVNDVSLKYLRCNYGVEQ